VPEPRADETALRQSIIALAAARYGRYGYRRVTGLLCLQGWQVGQTRVERIWRQAGLKVPPKQPKRARGSGWAMGHVSVCDRNTAITSGVGTS